MSKIKELKAMVGMKVNVINRHFWIEGKLEKVKDEADYRVIPHGSIWVYFKIKNVQKDFRNNDCSSLT